jgi:AcrR family transcriptional regulator
MVERTRISVAAEARARTRDRLVEGGRELFAQRGLHHVTSHDIASQAGVATGTFYNHFKDKHELFKEVARQSISELMQIIDRLQDSSDDFRVVVRNQVEALADFAIAHRDLILILFSGDHGSSSVESDLIGALAQRIADDRRRTIQAGLMPAEIDPDVYAQALVGMWARVLTWWAEDPARKSRDVLVQTLSQIELFGTHPGPPR